MKQLLLLAFIIMGTVAYSQTHRKLNVTPAHPLYDYNFRAQLKKFNDPGVPEPRGLQQKRTITTIIELPQDRMPCLVPADVQLGNIINPWSNHHSFQGIIPNPVIPDKTLVPSPFKAP